MVLLVNQEFLAELEKFYQKAEKSGSVSVTMKRYDGRTKPNPRDGSLAVPDPVYKCLVRAQYRSKKISTVIEPEDVEIFTDAYTNLIKKSTNSLKKLKKTKKKRPLYSDIDNTKEHKTKEDRLKSLLVMKESSS